MKPFASLRHRIIAAAFAVALVVCAIFSFGVFMTFDHAEDLLFDAHIELDVSTFLAQYALEPTVALLPRHNFVVHIAPNVCTSRSRVEPFLSALRQPCGERQ